jgi:hypothetical protein
MLLVVRAIAGSHPPSGNKETLTTTVWLLATPSARSSGRSFV